MFMISSKGKIRASIFLLSFFCLSISLSFEAVSAEQEDAASPDNSGSSYLGIPEIPSPEEIKKRAFKSVVEDGFPLSPEQIREWKKRSDDSSRVANEDVNVKIEYIDEIVPFSPGGEGKKSIDLFLSTGSVSSVTFLDRSGNPWPVSIPPIVGKGGLLTVSPAAPNIFFISTDVSYAKINLAFMLDGMTVPVYFHVNINRNKAHENLVISIQRNNPGADRVLVSGDDSSANRSTEGKIDAVTADENVYGFLTGDPEILELSETLRTKGFPSRAWFKDGKVYLKIKDATLLSSRYDSFAATSDGYGVYRLPYSPLLMVVSGGKVFDCEISRPLSE